MTLDRVLVIDAAGRDVLMVEVERALTQRERMMGLRGRSLHVGHGLVLDFATEQVVCITNEDVPQDLDLIFVSQERTVASLERELPAGDSSLHCAVGRYVVEVLAGTTSAVMPGQRVVGL